MRISEMNWMMVEEYLTRDDRAVFPLGCTEQHAYLSFSVDSILAERLAGEAADPLGVPVFPVLAYGITVEYVATRRHGNVFSTAISPATTAIHDTLMTPRANSDAISAQQQPTHQAPFLTPIRTAPPTPSRHQPSRAPSGLRHLPRQTSFSGVSSYTAATIRVAPAIGRPAFVHANWPPATCVAAAAMP